MTAHTYTGAELDTSKIISLDETARWAWRPDRQSDTIGHAKRLSFQSLWQCWKLETFLFFQRNHDRPTPPTGSSCTVRMAKTSISAAVLATDALSDAVQDSFPVEQHKSDNILFFASDCPENIHHIQDVAHVGQFCIAMMHTVVRRLQASFAATDPLRST